MNQKMDSLVELIIEEKKHWVTILFTFNSFFFSRDLQLFSVLSTSPPPLVGWIYLLHLLLLLLFFTYRTH